MEAGYGDDSDSDDDDGDGDSDNDGDSDGDGGWGWWWWDAACLLASIRGVHWWRAGAGRAVREGAEPAQCE